MSQNKTKNTTIWERFQTEGLAEKDSRPEAVAQFVSIENANMLKGFIPNGTNEEAAEEATVFFVNFSAVHGSNKKIRKIINEHWANGPFLFQVAAWTLGLKNWYPIQESIAKNAVTISNYICQMQNEDRYVTIANDDSQTPVQYFFPQNIPKQNLLDAETCILIATISIGIGTCGSIVIRHGDDEKNTFTVEGIMVINGQFQALSAGQMKEANERMPDGTIQPDNTAKYRMPPVIFQNPKK